MPAQLREAVNAIDRATGRIVVLDMPSGFIRATVAAVMRAMESRRRMFEKPLSKRRMRRERGKLKG